MKNILSHVRGHKVLYIILAIVILIVLWIVLAGKKDDSPATVTATRNVLVQEVSVTGKVTPAEDIDLAFERGGKISAIYTEVGDMVRAGQALVALDTSELQAQLDQAQASLGAQTAKLDALKRGSRPEDIATKKTELAKAEQDLQNNHQGIGGVIHGSYISADDAIRKQMDDLFFNDEEPNASLAFQTISLQTKTDAEGKRYSATGELKKWLEELAVFDATAKENTKGRAALVSAKTHLEKIRDVLSSVNAAVLDATGLSSASLSSYRANLNTARANVNNALTSVNNQIETIASQELVVARIQNELNKMLAGSDPQDIRAQEAQVAQAEASVALIRAQISKTILRAPLTGIITKQNAKIGAIIAANVPLVSLISSQLWIEANIPEADIAKIKIDNPVRFTLDAYGEDVKFQGTVASVDPGETLIEGVATYKTKVVFGESSYAIKSGMTANLDIETDRRENALMVPQRSVKNSNGIRTVKIYFGGKEPSKTRVVEVGLRGSEGNIEITSGLQEGDVVLSSPD